MKTSENWMNTMHKLKKNIENMKKTIEKWKNTMEYRRNHRTIEENHRKIEENHGTIEENSIETIGKKTETSRKIDEQCEWEILATKCSKWVILVAKTKEGSLDDQKKNKQRNKKSTKKCAPINKCPN